MKKEAQHSISLPRFFLGATAKQLARNAAKSVRLTISPKLLATLSLSRFGTFPSSFYALNILDRFHIKGHLTDAVNETRKSDVKKLKAEGREAVLTKSKYIFLKNPENLTDDQAEKLSELLGYNLRVVRAYLMKEDFERFWEYRSAYRCYNRSTIYL